MQSLIRDLNRLYRDTPALHVNDCRPEGFDWIEANDAEAGVYAFLRKGDPGDPMVVVAVNMTPVARSYRLGLPAPGRWREPFETVFHWSVATPSIAIALVGIAAAAWLYVRKSARPDAIAKGLSGLYNLSFHKFYIDGIYLFITKNIIFQFVSGPVAWFDRHIVDGTMNFIGNSTVASSAAIKKMQSGHVQTYIWFFTSGALLLALLILYPN